MMYFSGVSSDKEAEALQAAGVQYFLCDPHDLPNVPTDAPHVALDSGAYRAYRSGSSLDIPRYLQTIHSRHFGFVTAPDVIGDPITTRKNWLEYRREHPRMLPVWGYGDDPADLHRYLDEAPRVGVGGLVPLMRAKDKGMLEHLTRLCKEFPQRLHLFGANWLQAIEVLNPLTSIDTSKFLDGARYGHLIFVNSRTGRLGQCPAKVLKGYYPQHDLSDRLTRLTLCACTLNSFCNQSEGLEAAA